MKSWGHGLRSGPLRGARLARGIFSMSVLAEISVASFECKRGLILKSEGSRYFSARRGDKRMLFPKSAWQVTVGG